MALPQIDAARARAFVLAHGNAVDAARLEGILGREQPDRAVVRALEGMQNPDGGFPAGAAAGFGLAAPGESSVAATCAVLSWLRDIPPLAGSPMAGRAVSFLRRSQQVDGSWLESWAAPDRPAQAILTARAAYTLLVMEADHPDPIVRGARWLRTALDGNLDRADSPALVLAAAVWGRLPETGPGGQAADAVYAHLRDRVLSAADLGLWLATFVELGLAARHLGLAVELLQQLSGLQEPDGGWPAPPGDGDGGRVEVTLGALRAFRGFGLTPRRPVGREEEG